MAFVSIPDDISNTVRLFKIDGRFIPVDQLAFFGPVPSRDAAEGMKSKLHLLDGSVLSIFSLSARETVEPFGTVYLPQDDIAISRSHPQISWTYLNPEDRAEGTLLVFGGRDLRYKPFGIRLKSLPGEVAEILHSRPYRTLRGYHEFPNGVIASGTFDISIGPKLG